MKKRLLSTILCVIMVLGLMTGCGNSEGSEDAGKSFRMAVNFIPETLIPTQTDDDYVTMLSPIYDVLFYPTSEGYDYRLAESIEVAEDGSKATIKLDADANWSDGTPVTVDDMLFTIDYLTKCEASNSFTLVDDNEVTFTKIDDKTVELALPVYNGDFIKDLGAMKLIPAHAFDGDYTAVEGTDYFQKAGMITSGAFTVAEYNEDSIVFAAREDYYRGTPNIDQLIMVSGSATQIAFENGEISYMRVTNATDLEKYSSDSENYNVFNVSGDRTEYLICNVGSTRLTDEQRQVIAMALDRDEIVEAAFDGETYASPAYSMFNPSQTVYTDEFEKVEFNLEEAKALAESTGLTDVTIRYIYTYDRPYMEQMATVIQQQLANIGVTCEVQGYDFITYTDMFYSWEDSWELGSYGLDSMRGDYTKYVGDMVSQNWNTAFTEEACVVAKELQGAIDKDEMCAKAMELQTYLNAEAWAIPVAYTNYVFVSPKNVTGLDQTLIPEFTDWLAINVE